MCGIAGKVGPAKVNEAEILRMCNAIAHRGPDDWGTFVEGGLGLGMRRLSIIDLAGGHQPLANEDGSVVVVFNGELYNYESLYAELQAKGHRFSTRTDTEVLVHLYEDEGEKMVQRLRGMFAFAIWDRTRARLLLARDHFGQKPLFYTQAAGKLTFASEMKALLADDPSLAELSPRALDQYLTMRFVHPPETFFTRIRALPPAHYMVWENGGARIERYWDLSYGPKWTYSEDDTLERIDELLAETVRLHLLGGRVPQWGPRLYPDCILCRADARFRAQDLLDGHSVSRLERTAICGGGGGAVWYPALRGGGYTQRR
jgi:asparagine synthase (glutamine-hydrolysing)